MRSSLKILAMTAVLLAVVGGSTAHAARHCLPDSKTCVVVPENDDGTPACEAEVGPVRCPGVTDPQNPGPTTRFVCRASILRVGATSTLEPLVANPGTGKGGIGLPACAEDARQAATTGTLQAMLTSPLLAVFGYARLLGVDTRPLWVGQGEGLRFTGAEAAAQVGTTKTSTLSGGPPARANTAHHVVHSSAWVDCSAPGAAPSLNASSGVAVSAIEVLAPPAAYADYRGIVTNAIDIPVGPATLHVNYRQIEANRIVARALWLETPAGTGDVVVAESIAGLTPGTTC